MDLLVARPLAAVLVSLVAAGLIAVLGRRPALREACTFAAAAIKFGLVASMLPAVLAGQVVESGPFPLAAGVTHDRVARPSSTVKRWAATSSVKATSRLRLIARLRAMRKPAATS